MPPQLHTELGKIILKRQQQRKGPAASAFMIAAVEPSDGYTCVPPEGGCPDGNKSERFFLNRSAHDCYGLHTSGCDGQGFDSIVSCKISCLGKG
ncbi:uncharacterized protein LOC142590896 isoform X2 [Dermacentor variabilis]|uniref:uncharacterized protein LOC142590896 isoform X2 n=1 Tax=Dermacentor variabilis TaxID=34621 RepID=UPI003F5C4578